MAVASVLSTIDKAPSQGPISLASEPANDISAMGYSPAGSMDRSPLVRESDYLLAQLRGSGVGVQVPATVAFDRLKIAKPYSPRKTYAAPFSLDSYPRVARVCRLVIGVALAGWVGTAALTAGPGRYQALSQPVTATGPAAAVPIALPRVVIVGKREATSGAQAVRGTAAQ